VTILALLAVGCAIVVALWRIGTTLQALSAQLSSERQGRGHDVDARQISESLSSISEALHNQNIERISGSLSSISATLQRFAPACKTEPEVKTGKETWQIENEKRDEINNLARDLEPEKFQRFVAYRYHLAIDDPWVMSMVKLRAKVGMDAVITALRNRDERRIGQ